MLWNIVLVGFAGQSDLHCWKLTYACEGKVEYREEGLHKVEIYHFNELFTSVCPYPETTTQVFNLFIVKLCLENLNSYFWSKWSFVYF